MWQTGAWPIAITDYETAIKYLSTALYGNYFYAFLLLHKKFIMLIPLTQGVDFFPYRFLKRCFGMSGLNRTNVHASHTANKFFRIYRGRIPGVYGMRRAPVHAYAAECALVIHSLRQWRSFKLFIWLFSGYGRTG